MRMHNGILESAIIMVGERRKIQMQQLSGIKKPQSKEMPKHNLPSEISIIMAMELPKTLPKRQCGIEKLPNKIQYLVK